MTLWQAFADGDHGHAELAATLGAIVVPGIITGALVWRATSIGAGAWTLAGTAGAGVAIATMSNPIVWLVIGGWQAALALGLFQWAVAERERPRVERCTKCGYDLRGLPAPVCPECGGTAGGTQGI
jgi:hypothetical protein